MIRDAAYADDDGLVHNLLVMHQEGACSMGVFGIPAVQVSKPQYRSVKLQYSRVKPQYRSVKPSQYR